MPKIWLGSSRNGKLRPGTPNVPGRPCAVLPGGSRGGLAGHVVGEAGTALVVAVLRIRHAGARCAATAGPLRPSMLNAPALRAAARSRPARVPSRPPSGIWRIAVEAGRLLANVMNAARALHQRQVGAARRFEQRDHRDRARAHQFGEIADHRDRCRQDVDDRLERPGDLLDLAGDRAEEAVEEGARGRGAGRRSRSSASGSPRRSRLPSRGGTCRGSSGCRASPRRCRCGCAGRGAPRRRG